MMPTLIVLDGHMVDHFVQVTDESVFSTLGVDPGCEYLGMHPWEWDALVQAVAKIGLTPTVLVGGSGANTARGFTRLGGKAVVHGQVGNDDAGRRVIEHLLTDGCDVQLRTVGGATGRCLVFVRPDGKRVMRSDVGVGMDFNDVDLVEATIAPGTWLHLTGYLLDHAFPIHRVAWNIMYAAVDQHVPISMDIGSGAYLDAQVIRDVVWHCATVLFLNDEEAFQLGLGSPEAAASELLRWAHNKRDAVVVVTQGARGVLVARGNEVIHVPAVSVAVRDTTGAGDAFASGFLWALTQGEPLEACARLGCQLAAQTIQVIGGVPEK
ncbi:adenosine kinase [Candidatus Uhrbacteria bacterium]|nr:adenosine kinase [Candidatus Uhrbacteria bacterium]